MLTACPAQTVVQTLAIITRIRLITYYNESTQTMTDEVS